MGKIIKTLIIDDNLERYNMHSLDFDAHKDCIIYHNNCDPDSIIDIITNNDITLLCLHRNMRHIGRLERRMQQLLPNISIIYFSGGNDSQPDSLIFSEEAFYGHFIEFIEYAKIHSLYNYYILQYGIKIIVEERYKMRSCILKHFYGHNLYDEFIIDAELITIIRALFNSFFYSEAKFEEFITKIKVYSFCPNILTFLKIIDNLFANQDINK